MAESFFVPLDAPLHDAAHGHAQRHEHFRATSSAVGPWDSRLCHGSPPAALLARALERELPEGARLCHLAYDFHGAVAVDDVSIDVQRVRGGARVGLSRATLSVGGRSAMELTAWRIAVSPDRSPRVPWVLDVPALPSSPSPSVFGDVAPFGYGEAMEWRFAEGAFDALGPAAVWTRPRVPLLPGEPVSPLGRLLLMVDSANGISAELPPSRYTFVPVALTVSVQRPPRTEWVGMRARTSIEPDGIGVCRTELFDEEGALGVAVQTLFVAPR